MPCPDMPAAVVFEPEEIVAAFGANKRQPPKKGEEEAKLGEVMRLVAMAGGFLGRKSDGDLGLRTIWRGMEHVMAFADGLRWAAQADTG